jgi:virulence-associated protein VapD
MFTAATGYELIKKEIGHFLQQHGFMAYKSATFYRFLKGVQSLQDQMTINVVIQGLFSPTCSFQVLQPGGRIGQFLSLQKDKWWHCNDKKTTLDGISEIKESLALTVLPSLQEKMFSAEQLIETFNTPAHYFLWQGQDTFIDQGYIYLKARRYNEALNIFRAGRTSKVTKYSTIQKCIEQGQFDKIDHLLQDNIHYQREKWKV